ncbi:MAG: hypothetical protein KAS32_14570 [Candidatus Peribacteraceae bacterium]|nr:hypothetical protein [Candidatus Peribacteraceae bacterium]
MFKLSYMLLSGLSLISGFLYFLEGDDKWFSRISLGIILCCIVWAVDVIRGDKR